MSGISIETASAAPYTIIMARAGAYPLDPAAATAAGSLASALLAHAPRSLNRTVFLQEQYMGNRKEEFTSHLRDWRPMSGLGVWPDRPPPRLWRTTDLFRMMLGQDVPLMFRVARLANQSAESDAFYRLMGSGMVMAISHAGSTENLLQLYKNRYLPSIQEPNLRILPFYVPLLDAKSVGKRGAAELSDWLGSASLYIRESPEDKGMLVITNLDVDPLLTAAGAKKDRAGRWFFD